MKKHLIVSMTEAKIYSPELKAILRERLEPLPGLSGRGVSVGTTIVAHTPDMTEVETEFLVWVEGAATGRMKQEDLLQCSTALRDQCGTPAFAALGDVNLLLALRIGAAKLGPFRASTSLEAICFPQGVLIMPELLMNTLFAETRERGQSELDAGILSQMLCAICPLDASNHERLEFARVATHFIAQRLTSDATPTVTQEHRDFFQDTVITISPERTGA